jgi:5'-nucleotidase
MRVLVSNDDGVDAPGIHFLARRLSIVGEVIVVAPDRDRSGASNSLTLDQPIRVTRLDDGRYRVAGTPTDACTWRWPVARRRARHRRVRHQQLGQPRRRRDLLRHRSAAMEGRFLGLPAIAVSLAAKDHKGEHYASAAQAALDHHAALLVDPLPADTILNVNVPDRRGDELRGFAVTRLGRRHRSARALPRPTRAAGRSTGSARRRGRGRRPGTDFHAVREGYISITPIQVDLTRYQALDKVAGWVRRCRSNSARRMNVFSRRRPRRAVSA